jgi:LDH2 family malate/lactate/ureidoglycolate dehydrogenase
VAEYREVEYAKLLPFCEALFRSYGFTADQSRVITDVLLRADLSGIESHGVQRLIRYHGDIKNGHVDVKAAPEVVLDTPISAVIDGHKGRGQLNGAFAMGLAIEKARKTGMGMVTLRNSNHYGIAGYYTNLALEADLVGVCMTNTEAICVPTFGKKAMLGTNPIAFAFPADPVPFSFDAATTVVPRGKLEVYDKNGKALPSGWVLDSAGHEANDAALVLRNIINRLGGGIAPLGGVGEDHSGYKGYGLALMVDIFCASLSGGATSNHVNTLPGQEDTCHFFATMDYAAFGDKADIKKRLSAFLQELRDAPKADGAPRIYIHGEKEGENRAKRIHATVPVNSKTWSELQQIAAEQKVKFI